MTWIVGASTLWGYGCIVSDIQITLQNKKTIDILQKAYGFDDFGIVGFAGSVMIGFMLLQSLGDHLKRYPKEIDPCLIVKEWSNIARTIYNSAPIKEQKLQSQFLIVAPSPTEKIGDCSYMDSKIYMFRLSSPDFKLGIMSKRNKMCSIGNGARVAKYKKLLQENMNLGLDDPTLKAEIMNPGGFAKTLAFSIFHTINTYPHGGISKYLHFLTVKRGEITMRANDITIHHNTGEIEIINMPKTVGTYQDLNIVLTSLNAEVACSIC